nr:pirin-like C-terminal cupin domain-containing protein [Methanococcoides sp. NM1]
MVATAGNKGLRFLLVSGKPINEPVAWYGPIVMNTQEELKVAFEEYRNGTFSELLHAYAWSFLLHSLNLCSQVHRLFPSFRRCQIFSRF